MTAGVETRGRGRTLRVDAHVHTAASYDSGMVPARLVERAVQADLDGVVVTDHDTVEGARVVADLAAARDLVVVVGCEVSTADGHLLAMGVEGAPEPGRPLVETARAVRESGGIAVVPHPFQRSRHGAGENAIANVDGVEVYNALTFTGLRNRQAERFAAREGYPPFAGSDAHRPETVGRAATEITLPAGTPPTAESVLATMRAGRTAAVGESISTRHLVSRVVTNAAVKTRSLR